MRCLFFILDCCSCTTWKSIKKVVTF